MSDRRRCRPVRAIFRRARVSFEVGRAGGSIDGPRVKNVLIAGCGRSGTSMLAGTLAGAGYYIGQDYIPVRDSNPKGFFEGLEINDLNERILSRVEGMIRPGRAGRSVPGENWLARVPLSAEVRGDAAIDAEIGALTGRAPFCFKDPRFCYTLPVWRPHLDLRTTVFLCIFRHPVATATSIARECRTQSYLKTVALTVDELLDLWRLMYRHILERHRRHGDWMFLHFDQMLDPALLPRLQAFTGARIDATFPDAALRRSSANSPADSESMAIYAELCRAAGHDPGDPTGQ